ncbi:hypothetical protein PBY51_012594 [Eleginops maclovinus]|uniref:Uncharacterized protein n=1 Tax=Eleginops maclovinus TaxID=56733 RepID=A0AAN7Y3U6_ELEMC|nr:hypothetical protein PBY51_012594 [Eleginops maclovinus]
MFSSAPEETELIEKHEEILGQRAELMEQMESLREQLRVQRGKRGEECEAAHLRNSHLLQDLQQIEDRLRGAQLPRPNFLAMETRYWASVEESLPAWEHFLLGKGPHPAPGRGHLPRRAKQRASTVTDQGLPPCPKRRTAP